HPCLIVDFYLFFFFKLPPPTALYTLSLHDALPISKKSSSIHLVSVKGAIGWLMTHILFLGSSYLKYLFSFQLGDPIRTDFGQVRDRKSTRLNSSHVSISYAVFCLKKKRMTCE